MWGFGYDATSAVQIKERYKHFKVGGESAESDPRSGRPATSRAPEDVERVWGAVNNDGWLTVWETDLGIPKTTVSEILMQDLGMKRVMAKFVLWLLLPEQKEHHAAVANDLIQTATNKPNLVPCNFWLFPNLILPLKEKRFQTVDEIQENPG